MLKLGALFHLNLMYSSIGIEDRGDVVDRCYTPLLDLAEETLPVALEASAMTLEILARLAPAWLKRLVALIDRGRIQFVGSGYSQIIGPLAPAAVNRQNLDQGRRLYGELLGCEPALWLVNEMAWSGGLPELYADVGAQALIMEWNNPWRRHPEWDPELRFHAQTARGCDGTELPLLWIDTLDFQKLQRRARDELSVAELVAHWRRRVPTDPDLTRHAALYGSDTEVFDFRPGRYAHEGRPDPGGEWQRIAEAVRAVAAEPDMALVPLSEFLTESPSSVCRLPLRLECAEQPVVVKKQQKYNLNRWAVTGRGDLEANTACHRLARDLIRRGVTEDDAWRRLLQLWSSDYRTHITAPRWDEFRVELDATLSALEEVPVAMPATIPAGPLPGPGDRSIHLATPHLECDLDLTRGLTVKSLEFRSSGDAFAAGPVLGTLPHGYFDDIAFGADFYTGHAVVQRPGRSKRTDLQDARPTLRCGRTTAGDQVVAALLLDDELKVAKQVIALADAPCLEFRGTAELPARRAGEIHPLHLTVVPGLFDLESLGFAVSNGGRRREVFHFAGDDVHHGAPYSTLVTATGGLGATDGVVVLGDAHRRLVVTHDPGLSALVPTVRFAPVRGGGYFLRLRYSAQEVDETFVENEEPWQVSWCVTVRAEGVGLEQDP